MILVKEEVGNCTRCGKDAILGDGLCVDCWCTQTNKLKNVKECEKEVTPLDLNMLIFSDACVDKVRPSSKQCKNLTVQISSVNRYKIEVWCKFCNGTKIKKYGFQNGVQYYYCHTCAKTFSLNKPRDYKKTPPRKSSINRYTIDVRCKHCQGIIIKKYGIIRNIQNYYCHTCARAFHL